MTLRFVLAQAMSTEVGSPLETIIHDNLPPLGHPGITPNVTRPFIKTFQPAIHLLLFLKLHSIYCVISCAKWPTGPEYEASLRPAYPATDTFPPKRPCEQSHPAGSGAGKILHGRSSGASDGYGRVTDSARYYQ